MNSPEAKRSRLLASIVNHLHNACKESLPSGGPVTLTGFLCIEKEGEAEMHERVVINEIFERDKSVHSNSCFLPAHLEPNQKGPGHAKHSVSDRSRSRGRDVNHKIARAIKDFQHGSRTITNRRLSKTAVEPKVTSKKAKSEDGADTKWSTNQRSDVVNRTFIVDSDASEPSIPRHTVSTSTIVIKKALPEPEKQKKETRKPREASVGPKTPGKRHCHTKPGKNCTIVKSLWNPQQRYAQSLSASECSTNQSASAGNSAESVEKTSRTTPTNYASVLSLRCNEVAYSDNHPSRGRGSQRQKSTPVETAEVGSSSSLEYASTEDEMSIKDTRQPKDLVPHCDDPLMGYGLYGAGCTDENAWSEGDKARANEETGLTFPTQLTEEEKNLSVDVEICALQIKANGTCYSPHDTDMNSKTPNDNRYSLPEANRNQKSKDMAPRARVRNSRPNNASPEPTKDKDMKRKIKRRKHRVPCFSTKDGGKPETHLVQTQARNSSPKSGNNGGCRHQGGSLPASEPANSQLFRLAPGNSPISSSSRITFFLNSLVQALSKSISFHHNQWPSLQSSQLPLEQQQEHDRRTPNRSNEKSCFTSTSSGTHEDSSPASDLDQDTNPPVKVQPKSRRSRCPSREACPHSSVPSTRTSHLNTCI